MIVSHSPARRSCEDLKNSGIDDIVKEPAKVGKIPGLVYVLPENREGKHAVREVTIKTKKVDGSSVDDKDDELKAAQKEVRKLRRALRFVVRRERDERLKTQEMVKEIEELQEENFTLQMENQLRGDYIENLRCKHENHIAEMRVKMDEAVARIGRRATTLAVSVSDQLVALQQSLQYEDEAKTDAILSTVKEVLRQAIEDLKSQNFERQRLELALENIGRTSPVLERQTVTLPAIVEASENDSSFSNNLSYDGSTAQEEVDSAEPDTQSLQIAKIQALIRGFIGLRRYNETVRSVVAAQAYSRGYLASKTLKLMRLQKRLQQQQVSGAVKIQALVRRFLVFRRYNEVARSIVVLQTCVRGYLSRKCAKNMRDKKPAPMWWQAVATHGHKRVGRRFRSSVRRRVSTQRDIDEASKGTDDSSSLRSSGRRRVGRNHRLVASRNRSFSSDCIDELDLGVLSSTVISGEGLNQEVTHMIREPNQLRHSYHVRPLRNRGRLYDKRTPKSLRDVARSTDGTEDISELSSRHTKEFLSGDEFSVDGASTGGFSFEKLYTSKTTTSGEVKPVIVVFEEEIDGVLFTFVEPLPGGSGGLGDHSERIAI